MSSKCYLEEFKIEAVHQVMDRGHSVAQVTNRLSITTQVCTPGSGIVVF